MTFTDAPSAPQMRLFAMVRTLDDAPALPTLAPPQPTPTPQLEQVIAVPPTPTPTRIPLSASASAVIPASAPGLGNSIWMGLAPAVILVALVLGLHFFKER